MTMTMWQSKNNRWWNKFLDRIRRLIEKQGHLSYFFWSHLNANDSFRLPRDLQGHVTHPLSLPVWLASACQFPFCCQCLQIFYNVQLMHQLCFDRILPNKIFANCILHGCSATEIPLQNCFRFLTSRNCVYFWGIEVQSSKRSRSGARSARELSFYKTL